ncbi:GerMN domain-containing protein [Actinoallomurus rhizosphaericola]|uniref:GerMN domain-containing protein n=1 Tax=Actinoallomurus rhizosphaericola TaxID=2952536 RepID=UPI00209060BA|nr:GerMN domain-containing protein [Actinoallomurus rhizosphaericola]MCO5994591.1 GerMN domain-containing protein [Actinoallomurus rhizosphaericola]
MTARLGFRVVLAVAAALLGAACGVRPTGVIGAGEPALAQQAVPQTTVYLVRNGRLVPERRVAFPGAPQAAVYALWLSGPTQDEIAAGIWSPLAKLPLYEITVDDGIMTVHYDRDGMMTRLVMAQIVCSGTAQPDVRRVRAAGWARVVGQEAAPGPPPFDLRHPPYGWTVVVGHQKKCSDYADLMAP